MPNISDWRSNTEPFKKNEILEYEKVLREFYKDNTISDIKKEILSIDDKLELECFIRYLFSALTDADWLDTEAHFYFEKTRLRSNSNLVYDDMIVKLEKDLVLKPKAGEINELRNILRKEALEKASNKSGFYSLNIPTGMGKTLTSFSWALHHAKANNLKRIFIVLPYINIIDQTAQILKNIFGEECILEHHSNYNENDSNDDTLSNKKKLASENWDYPVIVTTTVQFFESLFSNKTSKCRKIHNIADSVVIFDEVQSLPKEVLMPTLNMLKNVQKLMNASFVFCTATQPAFEKKDNFDGIKNIYPLIDKPEKVFNKTRRVNFNLLSNLESVKIDKLFENIKSVNSSVLVIFNTKKAVLNFYNTVINNQNVWEKCYHLSTAMCPFHRKEVIKKIREDLSQKRKIIVVSTQLIEAGVDFDFPYVFREIAPLESVIQSAGRCNREGSLCRKGEVYIFCLDNKEFKMPDKTYSACAEHTKSLLLQNLNDIYDYNFFKKYYSQIVKLYIDTDKYNIIETQKKFNFETVNDVYRIIDNKTEGLYIYNFDDNSKKLFHSIENKELLSRKNYRKMQAYTVQVYQNFLYENKEKYRVMPQGFLVWFGNYDNNTGISINNIEADKLIL